MEPGDPTVVPYHYPEADIQSYTSAGEFGHRYDFTPPPEETESIVSWKGGFERPDIIVNSPNGKRRRANQEDFKKRTFTPSDTGESEGESSVISVDDLGFSAAPVASLPQFHDFHRRRNTVRNDSETEIFMTLDQLRCHIGYHERPGESIVQLIGEKMEESFEKSKHDGEDYLPLDAFEAIFDIETIKSLVKEAYPENPQPDWERMVAHIIGSKPSQGYRRILGALVLMDQVSQIDKFIEDGISDFDLPIRRSPHQNKAFETRTGVHNSTIFKRWSRGNVELFYVYQKRLFVPFFDIQEDKLCSYVFDSNVRLPWKDFEHKTSGGNGLVHKVEIHSQHHNCRSANDPKKPLYFALKEIFTLDRDAYRRELWALEKSTAHAQRENHLIKLLLTFQHGEVCYLLFEWADGNLADFWEKTEIPPALSDVWAIGQFLGISNAIKRIHGLATWQKKRRSSRRSESDDEREWGRHGDIKPNNILWFSEYTTDSHDILQHHLVVSDLGLTRYHSQNTRSIVHRSHLEGCTWGYRPPEMDLGHLISSSYDIWSLGCVFLEFCVWYANGGEAVRIFGLKREHEDKSEIRAISEDKYFNIITNEQGVKEACLKPIVEEYLNTKLRESDRYTLFVEKMLSLIQRGMLIVDPKERWKIDQICAEISIIKAEISNVQTPIQPIATPTQVIDATPQVVDRETRSERLPSISIDLNDAEINDLVHHAQGNSGDILAQSTRRHTLSIHSRGDSDGVRDMQSQRDESVLGADEPEHDKTPPKMSSEGTQTTFDVTDSPSITVGPRSTNTTSEPRPSTQPQQRGIETTQVQEPGAGEIDADDEELRHKGEQESRRRWIKVHISGVWTMIRGKVEKYLRRALRNWRQTETTNGRTGCAPFPAQVPPST